jgi:2-oxoglutarate dehydrogenase complex dehydrogenase (E1) component-like enzyme
MLFTYKPTMIINAATEGKGIDWATAESLAFGTLLLEV